MDTVFHNLNLKWWHTVLLVASFCIFVLSITVELKGVDNTTMAFLSSGTFFIALGFFACQSFIQSFAVHRGKRYVIEKDTLVLSIPGFILIAIGSYLVYRAF